MSSETADTGFVQRIPEVRLRNYRGFKARDSRNAMSRRAHVLDTDAEVVLITGPNGHGKTSLLEALLLLLTGWYGDAHPVADLISRLPRKEGEEDAEPVKDCEIAADTSRLNQPLSLQWWADRREVQRPDDPLPMPKNCWSALARDDGKDPRERELDARLCAFFQDRVDRLFDEAASGRTLRDVFEPLPWTVDSVSRRFPLAVEALEGERFSPTYKEEWGGKPPAELAGLLAGSWQRMVAPLRDLALEATDWPADLDVPEAVSNDQELDCFARTTVSRLAREASGSDYGNLRDAFKQAIERKIEAEINRARWEAEKVSPRTAELQAQLDAAEYRLRTLSEEYPRAEEELRLFESSAPDTLDLPGASTIFRSLAHNARRWATIELPEADTKALARVLEEFAAVDEQEAARCAELLEVWLQPRRDAVREREELSKRIQELALELRRSLMSDKLEALKALKGWIDSALSGLMGAWEKCHKYTRYLRQQQGREDARRHLDAAIKAVEWCTEALEELTQPDPELMEEIRSRAEVVLRRFSLVEGFLPLRLKAEDGIAREGDGLRRSYAIRTGDGRLLQHLSTGQRAQVAVSLLVAQNLAVSNKLSHGVILLDDVTTAYDLSNLTREAILWRQLAYGTGDPSQRRQLFISSHHEDMTNHMLDLLVPPPGKKMLLIRFTGWTPADGPTFDTFEVEPSVFSKAFAPSKEDQDKDKKAPKWRELARDLERF